MRPRFGTYASSIGFGHGNAPSIRMRIILPHVFIDFIECVNWSVVEQSTIYPKPLVAIIARLPSVPTVDASMKAAINPHSTVEKNSTDNCLAEIGSLPAGL